MIKTPKFRSTKFILNLFLSLYLQFFRPLRISDCDDAGGDENKDVLCLHIYVCVFSKVLLIDETLYAMMFH